MATYGTDLVVIATGSDGESGTWGEFVGWASGGSPGAETENFIQNTQSQSQTFGNATTGKSIAFDAGSDVSASIPTGDVIMGWVFMGAPTNMYSYASGGHRFGIGASLTNLDMWAISGDNRPPNPYGGWWNVAIDPTVTPDYTGGTGSGGAWQFFGSLIGDTTLGIRVKIAKGNPHAVDGMLMGRGEIYCTGTGATFTLMAAQNDLVANRWGCLQDTGGGTFLWKGLMSLGQSGTSTTFSDSNKSISIDDTAKTYLAFNKIEIRNASTSVTWNNISFFSKGTLSPGQFEMVENATVAKTGCSFNNMDTFTYLSNGTLTSCNFIGCGVITHGGADFLDCAFQGNEGTADTSYMVYNIAVDPNGEMDGSSFTMGTALTHGIELGTSCPTSMTFTNFTTSGYHASNGQTSSFFHIKETSAAVTYTLNIIGGTGNFSYKSAGAIVNVVISPVALTVKVQDESDNTNIQYSAVTITAATTGPLPFEDTVTITSATQVATVAHTAHGLATGQKIKIDGAVQNEYNRIKTVTVTTTDAYTYPVVGTPTSPATGTIKATAIIIDGETDVNGEISDTRSYSANQDYTGLIQQGTRIPLYKARPVSGTVDKDNGGTLNVLLTKD